MWSKEVFFQRFCLWICHLTRLDWSKSQEYFRRLFFST
jgi:hypothetical protein